MEFEITDLSIGINILNDNEIQIRYEGTYNIQFSAQIEKTDSGVDEIDIWLRKNGTNVIWSNTKLHLDKNNASYVAAWNWLVDASDNDIYQIAWSSADLDMRLLSESAAVNPTRPAIPSVILTVSQITYTQIGPTGATGPQGVTGSQYNYITEDLILTDLTFNPPATLNILTDAMTTQVDTGAEIKTTSEEAKIILNDTDIQIDLSDLNGSNWIYLSDGAGIDITSRNDSGTEAGIIYLKGSTGEVEIIATESIELKATADDITKTEITMNDVGIGELKATSGTDINSVKVEANTGVEISAGDGTDTSDIRMTYNDILISSSSLTRSAIIEVDSTTTTLLNSDGTETSSIGLNPNGQVSIITTDKTSISSLGNTFEVDKSYIMIIGTSAIYDADYSSTYTNRSLVDKEYVDGLVMTGATGATGATGPQGIQGPQGATGATGPGSNKGSFGITIDGGGSAITTGVKGYVQIPYSGTITGWTILGDVSGSIVIDVWKDTYANYPPLVGDSIAGSEKPTLSSAIKNEDLTLSTWTTSVTEGDIIAFNVDSASTVTRVNLSINITKS